MMNIVKYRTREPGLRPRRTKLEIPGWAGGREPRADGYHEYVWHCLPFSEGAQYGIELFYPYENKLPVTTKDGKLIFDGDSAPRQILISSGLRSEVSVRSFTPTKYCSI